VTSLTDPAEHLLRGVRSIDLDLEAELCRHATRYNSLGMNTSGVIYALCDPGTGEIRYVGKTVRTPQRRLYYHMKKADEGSTLYVSNWLRSLEGVRPTITILDRGPAQWLDDLERWWIAYCRRMGYRLTNLTDGGDGGTRERPFSKEALAAMRAASLRRWSDPAQRTAQAETVRRTHTGMKRSEKTRQKQSEAKRLVVAEGRGPKPGPRHSEKSKRLLSERAKRQWAEGRGHHTSSK
jgi:hypothetical protein